MNAFHNLSEDTLNKFQALAYCINNNLYIQKIENVCFYYSSTNTTINHEVKYKDEFINITFDGSEIDSNFKHQKYKYVKLYYKLPELGESAMYSEINGKKVLDDILDSIIMQRVLGNE